MAGTTSARIKLIRQRFADAVVQGYADGALLSQASAATIEGYYDTAVAAGYQPGILPDVGIQDLPIAGKNS